MSLWSSGHPNAPFALSAATTILMLWYFWRLRWQRNAVLLAQTTAPTRPLMNVVRFFGQRNLRIAYAIVVSRAMFWAALFVYGPIYVVEAGMATWVAGGLLSAANAMLFLSPLVRRAADRYGTRPVITGSLVTMASCMLGLAMIRTAHPIGIVFWLGGAASGAALDVLGNIPFMRLVRPRERTAMTTVFSTWRELAFLLTPVVALAALSLDAFRLLHLTLGVILVGAAATSSLLPRRI